MKKNYLLHVKVWALLIGIETLVYYENWGSADFWTKTLVNYTLVICLFYGSKLIAYKAINKGSQSMWAGRHMAKRYVYMLATMLIFISVKFVFDYFVFTVFYGTKIWFYYFVHFRFSLNYVIPAIFVAALELNRKIIYELTKKKRDLESTIETLELKALHLCSAIETKEHCIKQLEYTVNELVCTKDVLTQDKTALENEISQQQNRILIWKAELLAGQEDYRQLALRYGAKFDFYGRQLSKYRNLYGRLDDEDDPE